MITSNNNIIVEDNLHVVEYKVEKEEVEKEVLTEEHNKDVLNIVI